MIKQSATNGRIQLFRDTEKMSIRVCAIFAAAEREQGNIIPRVHDVDKCGEQRDERHPAHARCRRTRRAARRTSSRACTMSTNAENSETNVIPRMHDVDGRGEQRDGRHPARARCRQMRRTARRTSSRACTMSTDAERSETHVIQRVHDVDRRGEQRDEHHPARAHSPQMRRLPDDRPIC